MIFRGSQVRMIVAFFIALTLVGAVGYRWIEGWNWADSFYMTVITITAVGYHEVHPLSQAGRYWTTFVLAGGLTGLAAWFALITAAMVRMDLGNQYRRRKTRKEISRMRDHVIVCGGGRMGVQVVHELQDARQPFVLIDRDGEAIRALRRVLPDLRTLEDDATRDRVLEEAGIKRAKGLVTCLSGDTDNLYVCLSARHLNPDLVIVARAEGERAIDKMRRAGANHVVSPNVAGAVWVASVLVRPAVASFLDVTAPGSHLSRHLDHATVGNGSQVAGSTLAKARILDVTGLLVVAVRKLGTPPEAVLLNPPGDTVLEPGDDVIVLGDDEQVAKLREYVG